MGRGALWNRWDLHIHTPASYEWSGGKRLRDISSVEERTALLEQVVKGINASNCAVVAVMDYWTFDGVIALRDYLKQPGAIKCDATILPGIELRMVSPGDFRLNMHVILNEGLSDEKLQAFKSQLHLSITDKPLNDDYLIEWAREHLTDKRLAQLGTSKATVMSDKAVALIAASKTVEVSTDSVKAALKQFGSDEAILFVPFDTNDGVKKIKFREHHSFPNELLAMEAIFEVGNQGTRDAFAGIQTNENQEYFSEFQEAIKHPKLAVRGSDAHKITDYGSFPGGRATWIKASPNFSGLLQACKEPANRSFTGPTPPKLDFVARNPQLFIESIHVRKRAGAPEIGAWLDGTNLEFNQDLVALIGKKGSGKSALADVLGLLGDTLNSNYFSFLSEHRFRLKKDDKASSFEAMLKWNQDAKAAEWRLLSSSRSPSSVQRVKYLPQRYFEELCNDHVAGDDKLLQEELKQVIYSHIPHDERDGAYTLDDIIDRRSASIEREIATHRSRLTGVNSRILSLTAEVTPDAQQSLRQSVRLALVRLRALKANVPVVLAAPSENDEVTAGAAKRIEELNALIDDVNAQIESVRNQSESDKGTIRIIDDVKEHIARVEKYVKEERLELDPKLSTLQLEVDEIITFATDLSKVDGLRTAATQALEAARAKLDETREDSLTARLSNLRGMRAAEQTKMNEPMKLHQESIERLKDWEQEWKAAVGNPELPESFAGLWAQLRALGTQRQELNKLVEQRTLISIEILRCLKQRAELLRQMFSSVQKLIDEEPQIKDALGVNFSVKFSFDPFVVRLFDFVKQSVGSFAGIEESRAVAQTLIATYDLETEEGLRAFLDAAHLKLTTTNTGKPVALTSLVKSNRTPSELMDFLFGLSYADLSYGLNLDNVELERLSPGQRGALLLIFYLLVDRERIPIILDQPEENLDNETVYKLLVNVLTRAKQHRQVIMVTHNANLAVACDAEQVIVCTMRRDGTNQIEYTSGGIEELALNRAAVDILEGTKPAFENRRRKYR
ncbi:TrlF family AAA-like ATPase [Pseudoduganella rhizocola]|uniref:TrlF family AAA-like ATPase n=1 Tax=Pseudoduganella rhizocola TaxID=3382643 RepID=UPI0038B5B652